MKNMNILIASNTKFMEPTSVMVYSLCRTHKDIDVDIYLAYHDLKECDIERLQKIVSGFGKRLHPLDVGGEFASRVFVIEQFSYETYYRILAINMLPQDMERILYLDADMLIKKDLTEVYEMDMDDKCPFIVCEDIEGHKRGTYEQLLDRIGIHQGGKYFNAGFMLMNLKYLRKMDSVNCILDAFYRIDSRYLCPDQDVLNHMYYDKVQYAPWSLYNLPPEWWKIDTEALSRGKIRFANYQEMFSGQKERFIDVTLQIRDNAHIIHYLSFLKPWHWRDKQIYEDVALYAGLWFDCEREMYENIEGLERL